MGVKMSEWINVKDKLPEKMGSFVCFMKDGHNEDGVFKGFFRIATFTLRFVGPPAFYSNCEDITKDVLYWLPLPKLPELPK